MASGARAARFDGPPVITIAAPSPDQTYLIGATVIVQARVENAGPDLARVSVWLDDALLGEKRNPNETNASVLPLTIDWPASSEGAFRISVVAERGDGSAAREDVSIRVVSASGGEAAAPAPTAAPDHEPAPGDATETERQGAETAPGRTGESRVAGTMTQPARIRVGPGASYDLLGSLDENHEVTIIAVNPTLEWYRIAYDDPIEAWVYAEFVRPAADVSGVPVERGPPLPAEKGSNLVVVDVSIEPPIVCAQETIARARIRNDGTDAAQGVAWVIAEAVLLSDGASLSEDPPLAYLKTLKAAEEEAIDFSITLTAQVDAEQVILVTVDSGNHLPEINETDNTGASAPFILQRGDCG